MRFINALREARVRRIEQRVAELNEYIEGLDPLVWPDSYADALNERRRLWLLRSRILKKLPPVYEGATTQ